MEAECASGDGTSFYASIFPGGVLTIELIGSDQRMTRVEIRHEDVLRLAALVQRNTQNTKG